MDEAQARAAIVDYCARLWERRLVTGSSGNVSVRLAPDRIVVTPSGRGLGRLAPADLVCVDAAGRALDGGAPSSELPLHLAAYRTRADAACVVHTHPTFCVVWSRTGGVFPQDTVGARETLGPVGWAAYHPAGSAALADACARQFAGGFDVVLMERHGLSAIGADLEDAFLRTDLAEEAARIGYFGKFTSA